ncbi:hypothetical protein QOL99_12920 [Deinococcus sp. MIMF12]|uniref:DUF4136 domain-containing protein n=1 Tax=Deinococcus rhizophilus TaxID=3049544 RepID=A0ABT7JKC0_9DEIO|nr:hypothetical protein [Deinococcus rhizophilus]MDL2345047.1 hypothetical protein [Deinococcus rhizophilus]
MRRAALLLALLMASPVSAQSRPGQTALLPYVTLQAPGYAVRAEVRPTLIYPESVPNAGPYWYLSPAQVRVVLDPPGPRWASAYPADMPPYFVTVTPVQNWLTLARGEGTKKLIAEQVDRLRSLGKAKVDLRVMRDRWPGLPYLPLINAAQAVTGAARQMKTTHLQGVRYLAIYAQETSVEYPRRAVFYTFQGLTQDGQHVVSVRLPYAPTSFPVEVSSRPLDPRAWLRYRDQARARLNAEHHQLGALDQLVQSIRIR